MINITVTIKVDNINNEKVNYKDEDNNKNIRSKVGRTLLEHMFVFCI